MNGRVEEIFIAPVAKAPLVAVPQALAIAHLGLEGDRYATEAGSFSRWPGTGRAVSLIEAEALQRVLTETGIDLTQGRSRRNLVTRDVTLAHLVGKTFRIGSAIFRGERLCAPCAFLERLTVPGAFQALKGRGGLRADVVDGGIIRAGDSIESLHPRRDLKQ